MNVTPCMGVWIEILTQFGINLNTVVTPCMGVWIEIQQQREIQTETVSLPAWECGLKYGYGCIYA